jgi:hypothetical protein
MPIYLKVCGLNNSRNCEMRKMRLLRALLLLLALLLLHLACLGLSPASAQGIRIDLRNSLEIVAHSSPDAFGAVDRAEDSPPPPMPSPRLRAPAGRSPPLPTTRRPSNSTTFAVYDETPLAALERARELVHVPAEWQRIRSSTFAAYVELHRAFLRAGAGHSVEVEGRGTLRRRFLLVKPCCQLCNRLRVLVSALALGILTDRAVLIDFDGRTAGGRTEYYGRFDDLFTSPMDVQARLPRDVLNDGSGDGHGRTLPWLSMMSDFMCMEPLAWSDPVVTLEGSPAFLHSLLLNPSLRQSFQRAFGGSVDGLFRDILRSLLPPRREIVKQAEDFLSRLRKHDGGGGPPPVIVGLHIRNGRDFRTHKLAADEWRQLAACAAALAPRSSATLRPGSQGGVGGGGSAAVAPPTMDEVSVRFAVATESGESRNAASAALGAAAAFFEEALPKGKASGGSASREGAKRALLELLIVSMSNASVLTPMSSFSETAAALSGRPGLYFHFDLSRKFHHESATEALPGCFVPWTSEMPGSMNMHSILSALPCAESVRAADEARSPWTRPAGLRFLHGGRSRLPEELAKKVTPY